MEELRTRRHRSNWKNGASKLSFPHVTPTYTLSNKNPSAWNFVSPEPEVTCGTVAIIIRVVLLSPYLRIRVVSLSFIHHNQSHRLYRMSQEEWTKLRESVPYVKLYRYNPKHLYPKLNGYGDNGHRKVWASGVSTYCKTSVTPCSSTAHARQRETTS